tara:strand:- start:194 stop:529 length:336 start_codon:yes stop_codon:yes gene_type:complete
MKITKRQLRRIIKEEKARLMTEQNEPRRGITTSELINILSRIDPVGDRLVTVSGPSGVEVLGDVDVQDAWFEKSGGQAEAYGDEVTIEAVRLVGIDRDDMEDVLVERLWIK